MSIPKLFAVAIAFLSFSFPVRALELRVPTDHATIQEAITAAVTGDTVVVERGSYAENFSLKDGVVVRGEEARETILTGTVTTVAGGVLRRFTVRQTGIDCGGIDGLVLTNNVFDDITGEAVAADGCTDLLVQNNTFYSNDVGVQLDRSSGTVAANVFVSNGTPINSISSVAPGLTVRANHFYDNSQAGEKGTEFSDGDPLLVADSGGDFHLRSGSPLIGSVTVDGLVTEPGAYGGVAADPVPAVVTGVTIQLGSPLDDGGTVGWDANLAHQVSGYRLYYGDAPGVIDGTGAAQGNSPVAVTGPASAVLDGLPLQPPLAELIDDLTAVALDQRVVLSWSPVVGADGYTVFSGTVSGAYSQATDVGSDTTFTLEGLDNGTEYFFAVTTYVENVYHVAVSSVTAAGAEGLRSVAAKMTLRRSLGGASAEQRATPADVPVGSPELPQRGLCFLELTTGAGGLLPAVLLCCFAAVGLLLGRGRGGVLLVVLAGVLLLPLVADARGWALSVGAGAVYPAMDEWQDDYEGDVLPAFRAAVGYRWSDRWEFGVEGGYQLGKGEATVAGKGDAPDVRLDQRLSIFPVQLYALYQWRTQLAQRVVPYLGAGVGRHYYRREVEDEETTSGYLSGYDLRAGLRLSLNSVDPQAAKLSRHNLGLQNTALYLEGRYSRYDDFHAYPTDLGGWGAFAGMVFEF